MSIGTNDLSQYTLAVDRTNSAVASIASGYHPAVLRLIKQVIDAAHARDKWVGLCGELAGEPHAIPILLGLGLDEFSINPHVIPIVKHIIRSISFERLAAHRSCVAETWPHRRAPSHRPTPPETQQLDHHPISNLRLNGRGVMTPDEV